MKKFFVCVLCLMLGVTALVGGLMVKSPTYVKISADSETTSQEVNKITVTGSGEVKLAPDIAIISLGVETLNESLATAQKENSDAINNLISSLKDMGVKEENIKTKNFYVYQRYDYSKGEQFLGYQVSNYIDFKTKDIDNVGSIVTKLMESGANRLNGISFTLENQEAAYNQALVKALDNAKSKASIITQKPVSSFEVNEENSYTCISRECYSMNSFTDTTIMKGEICVKATIKVTFEY